MAKLTSYEISQMFKDLKDIFYFYGFTEEDIKDFLNYSGSYTEFSDEKLLEIEGVTNATLFHLKYKI